MDDLAGTDPTCFRTVQETRYWDTSGDGTNDSSVVISYSYDSAQNRTQRVESWDLDNDGTGDSVVTISYSLFNYLGDYQRKVIDSSQDSIYSYTYDSRGNLSQRIEKREEADTPGVIKLLTYYPSYDTNGDKTSYRLDIDSSSDGTVNAVQSYQMTYDAQGKVLTKSYYYDTEQRYSTSYINTYSGGLLSNVIWEKVMYDGTTDTLVYGITNRNYDENGDLIAEEIKEYGDASRDTDPLLFHTRQKVRSSCSELP